MTPAVAERMPSLFDVAVGRPAPPEAEVECVPAAVECVPAAVERVPAAFDAVGGEPTLDEVLSGVWEGLAAHRVEECPVCGGEMAPVDGVHPRPIAGRCGRCHSVLS